MNHRSISSTQTSRMTMNQVTGYLSRSGDLHHISEPVGTSSFDVKGLLLTQ